MNEETLPTNRLLMLIDGSQYATSVCDHAAWVAKKLDSAVDVVHVLTRRDGGAENKDLSGSIGLGARSSLLDELSELDARRAKLAQEHGRAILDDAKKRLIDAGIQHVTTRLRHGEIAETVSALETEANLIVLGKRGEAADFESLHLGSNLERVIRQSHKPVLVASRTFNPIERVMVAYDGGKSAEKAIDIMAQNPGLQNMEVHLLSVTTGSSLMQGKMESAAKRLESFASNVVMDTLTGMPEKVIAEEVAARKIGLLVMGAYGHSRIRSLLIGSTTTEMVRACQIPVVLVR
jgi:nucleotide-binding universal stress UspA family protein